LKVRRPTCAGDIQAALFTRHAKNGLLRIFTRWTLSKIEAAVFICVVVVDARHGEEHSTIGRANGQGFDNCQGFLENRDLPAKSRLINTDKFWAIHCRTAIIRAFSGFLAASTASEGVSSFNLFDGVTPQPWAIRSDD
jgi:hypothetical protein